MLVFALYSVIFNVTILASSSPAITDLGSPVNKDYKFLVIVKFFNDLWVFLMFFYVGHFKSKGLFGKNEEHQ